MSQASKNVSLSSMCILTASFGVAELPENRVSKSTTLYPRQRHRKQSYCTNEVIGTIASCVQCLWGTSSRVRSGETPSIRVPGHPFSRVREFNVRPLTPNPESLCPPPKPLYSYRAPRYRVLRDCCFQSTFALRSSEYCCRAHLIQFSLASALWQYSRRTAWIQY